MATVERNDSLLTGRNLLQNQAQDGDRLLRPRELRGQVRGRIISPGVVFMGRHPDHKVTIVQFRSYRCTEQFFLVFLGQDAYNTVILKLFSF